MTGVAEGYTCECGTEHRFPSYVYAHWRDVIDHTCETCGAVHSIVCGLVTLKEAGRRLVRWVGWRRYRASDPAVIDSILGTGTKLHAVEGDVGGYADDGHGKAGKALCGVAVPADDPDVIRWWTINTEGPRCRRCQARAEETA